MLKVKTITSVLLVVVWFSTQTIGGKRCEGSTNKQMEVTDLFGAKFDEGKRRGVESYSAKGSEARRRARKRFDEEKYEEKRCRVGRSEKRRFDEEKYEAIWHEEKRCVWEGYEKSNCDPKICKVNSTCEDFYCEPVWCQANKDDYASNPMVRKKKFHIEDNLKLNWYAAYMHCQSKGWRLATSMNKQENDDMVAYIKSKYPNNSERYFWIGGTEMNHFKCWKWMSTGCKFDFTDWRSDEPNNQGGNEHCLSLLTLQWNDLDCGLEKRFVCEFYDM